LQFHIHQVILGAEFEYSEDRSKAQCRICSRKDWIQTWSVAAYLASKSHQQAKERTEEVKRMREQLASERQADSATDALWQLHFATPKVHGPVSGHASRSQLEQEQEAEMWREYGMNGADLVGGMETESSEAHLYE
jgi:hypothetical protein